MLTPTYMDYSSTTPVDARVANKMAKYLTMEGDFGNAASRSHITAGKRKRQSMKLALRLPTW